MKMRSTLPWLIMAALMLVLMGSDLSVMGEGLMLMLVLMVILMVFWMKSRDLDQVEADIVTLFFLGDIHYLRLDAEIIQ